MPIGGSFVRKIGTVLAVACFAVLSMTVIAACGSSGVGGGGGTKGGSIKIGSVLALIDERELGYYRRNSRRLSDLSLTEPWIDDDGAVREARTAA